MPPGVTHTYLSDVTTSDQISQAFPLRICILQVTKYWRWEGPGNEATVAVFCIFAPRPFPPPVFDHSQHVSQIMEEGGLKDLVRRRTGHVQSDYVIHVKYSTFHRQCLTILPSSLDSITWNID